jgi:hypothetical protein
MVPVVPRPGGGFAAVMLSPDDYVARSGETLTRFGFVERELARRTERFGNVVHAWSTYEGRFTAPGAPRAEPLRGVNSIQLTSDGTAGTSCPSRGRRAAGLGSRRRTPRGAVSGA